MNIKTFLLLFACSVVLFSGCGSKEEEQVKDAVDQQMSEMEKSAQEYQKSMEQLSESMGEGKKVETVDFRELKSLLPESAGGLKRTNASGEKTSTMGISVSHAKGDYQSEDGVSSIGIDLTDTGSMSAFTAFGTYAWFMTEFDRETDTGYEKTTNFAGNRAFEKYDNNSKYGSLSVLVGKRFIVQVDGYNVSMSAIKDAAGKIDMKKLEGWKDFGVQ